MSTARRTTALAVAVFGWGLLQTFVVPALPTLRIDLHAKATWTAWAVTAYILVGMAAAGVPSEVGLVACFCRPTARSRLRAAVRRAT